MQVVHWLARSQPTQLTEQQLVKPILDSLFKLCSEPDSKDHKKGQLSARKFAAEVRGVIARHGPQPLLS